ncbi:MAG: hypothetical protein C4K49_03475 [Candidatus Thorarchaeota archaeon]|nr:MAG: hypothetical protein C4K49_03475 [Candidatus Thorarchaeota archaeon]
MNDDLSLYVAVNRSTLSALVRGAKGFVMGSSKRYFAIAGVFAYVTWLGSEMSSIDTILGGLALVLAFFVQGMREAQREKVRSPATPPTSTRSRSQ